MRGNKERKEIHMEREMLRTEKKGRGRKFVYIVRFLYFFL